MRREGLGGVAVFFNGAVGGLMCTHPSIGVKDIFTDGSRPIQKDSTLLEIIFEMTVKQKSKLFMVEEDGTLAGAIDRFCIIDKILFF